MASRRRICVRHRVVLTHPQLRKEEIGEQWLVHLPSSHSNFHTLQVTRSIAELYGGMHGMAWHINGPMYVRLHIHLNLPDHDLH